MAYKKKVEKEHAFKVMNRALKNRDIPAVVALFGVEKYLIDWAANSIIKLYIDPAALTFDCTVIDDDKVTIEEIIQVADTFPMMSEKKVVWVKNFKALKDGGKKAFGESGEKALLDYIAHPNPSSILILSNSGADSRNKVIKGIKKSGEAYDFEPIDKVAFSQFARQRIKEGGKDISDGNLSYLADRTGYFLKENDYNLNKLNNDLMKITAHCDGPEITKFDIDSCVAGSDNTFVFELINNVTANNKDKAFSLLHNILAKDDNIYGLLALMVGQFEFLLGVKEYALKGFNYSRIAAEMNVNQYRVKYAMDTVNRISLDDLKRNLINLYETDRNIKTGLIRSTMAMELFIARM